ncbi:hypothetical protein BVG19_g1872 [[Candida] boidinii]|nr:hypothetical protein BVG19_g1872 [[Candida] boidinii]OWB51444.1 hypothetical protein B5S27_g3005 [[Candida] boidinii]
MEEDFNQPLDIEAISVAQLPKERNITPELLEEAFNSRPQKTRSLKQKDNKRVVSCYASLPFEQNFVSPAFPELEDIDKAVEKRLSLPPANKIDTNLNIPVTTMNEKPNSNYGNDASTPIPLPKDGKKDNLIVKKTRKVFQPNGAFADGPSDAKEYFRVLSSEFNHFAQKFTSKKQNMATSGNDTIAEPKFNEEKNSRRVKSFNPEKLMHFRYSMNLTNNNIDKNVIDKSETTHGDQNKNLKEITKSKEKTKPSFERHRSSSVSLTDSFKSMSSIKPLYSAMSHTNHSQPSQEVLKAIAVDEQEEKNIRIPAAYRLDPVYTSSVSTNGRQRHHHRRNGSNTSSVPTFSSGVRSSMSDVSDSFSLPQHRILHVRRSPTLKPLLSRPMTYPVHNKPLPIIPNSGSPICRTPSRVTRSAKHRSKRDSNSPVRFKISPNLTPKTEIGYVTSRYDNFAKPLASKLELPPPACQKSLQPLAGASSYTSHNIDSLDEVLGDKTLINNIESNDNVSLKSNESFDTIEQIIYSYGRLNGDSKSEIFDKEAAVSTASPSSSTTSLTLNLNKMDKNIDGLYENIENMKGNMFEIDKNIQLMDGNMNDIDKSMKNMDKAMKDLDEKFSEVNISSSVTFNCQSDADLTKKLSSQSQGEETQVTSRSPDSNSPNSASFPDTISASSTLTAPQKNPASPASPTSTVFFSCRESLGAASSVFSGNQSSDESSVSSGSEHDQYHYNNTYPVKEETQKSSNDKHIRQASIYVKHKSGFVSPITKMDQNKFREYNNKKTLNAKQYSGYVKTGVPVKSQLYENVNFVDTEYERMRKGSDLSQNDLSSLSSFSSHRRTESNESNFSYAESISSKMKNIEIPKDTSVFTRNPTYRSQISHSSSCYSNKSKTGEDPTRMTSVKYFKEKGISPFTHSGYEKSKTLRVTNKD